MAAVPEIGRATRVEARVAPEATATQELYERYSTQLLGFCFHKLGNREEAEDAVQQTFLNAFRGLQRGIVPEAESAWLFKIAENVCLTRRRSSFRRGRVEAPSDIQALQEFVAAPQRLGTEELIQLQEALAAMPASQRKAILLREWQGLSYREIAEEMELSQPAVETLIFRARRSLAGGLERTPERKSLLSRLRNGLDLGGAVAGLKTLLAGALTAKAVATTAAAVTVAGAVVVSAPEPRGEEAPRSPLSSATQAAPIAPEDVAPAPVVRAVDLPDEVRTRPASPRVEAPRRSEATTPVEPGTPPRAQVAPAPAAVDAAPVPAAPDPQEAAAAPPAPAPKKTKAAAERDDATPAPPPAEAAAPGNSGDHRKDGKAGRDKRDDASREPAAAVAPGGAAPAAGPDAVAGPAPSDSPGNALEDERSKGPDDPGSDRGQGSKDKD